MKNELMEEKAIRRIIDLYAFYADTKDSDKQVALFTDDLKIESFIDSTPPKVLESFVGKENLNQSLVRILSPYQKTMHYIGQTIIELKNETEAEGIVYCRAYHYNKIDNTEKLMIPNIRYLDRYKKIGDKWFFSERRLSVQWIENR